MVGKGGGRGYPFTIRAPQHQTKGPGHEQNGNQHKFHFERRKDASTWLCISESSECFCTAIDTTTAGRQHPFWGNLELPMVCDWQTLLGLNQRASDANDLARRTRRLNFSDIGNPLRYGLRSRIDSIGGGLGQFWPILMPTGGPHLNSGDCPVRRQLDGGAVLNRDACLFPIRNILLRDTKGSPKLGLRPNRFCCSLNETLHRRIQNNYYKLVCNRLQTILQINNTKSFV